MFLSTFQLPVKSPAKSIRGGAAGDTGGTGVANTTPVPTPEVTKRVRDGEEMGSKEGDADTIKQQEQGVPVDGENGPVGDKAKEDVRQYSDEDEHSRNPAGLLGTNNEETIYVGAEEVAGPLGGKEH
jgi:hypothetical protein